MEFFSRNLQSSVRHDYRFRGCLALAFIVAGVVLCGCKESSLKLYPVRGQVFFKDQPAEGAKVVFLPAGEENAQFRGARPAATVSADGSFEMQTEPQGAGAPAGGLDLSALNAIQLNERETLNTLLDEHRWNVSNVARALGISRNTLYRKMRRLSIRLSHENPGFDDMFLDDASPDASISSDT